MPRCWRGNRKRELSYSFVEASLTLEAGIMCARFGSTEILICECVLLTSGFFIRLLFWRRNIRAKRLDRRKVIFGPKQSNSGCVIG